MSISKGLLIASLIVFILACVPVTFGVSLIPLGLALFVASHL